jgi:hypothetical protein
MARRALRQHGPPPIDRLFLCSAPQAPRDVYLSFVLEKRGLETLHALQLYVFSAMQCR